MAGILPDTFRIMRIVLARLYDKENGQQVCEELQRDVEHDKRTEAVEI
jgi:hypothetical protein